MEGRVFCLLLNKMQQSRMLDISGFPGIGRTSQVFMPENTVIHGVLASLRTTVNHDMVIGEIAMMMTKVMMLIYNRVKPCPTCNRFRQALQASLSEKQR